MVFKSKTTMALLKYTLMGLIVTSSSGLADPLKQKPPTVNIVMEKNVPQQKSNEIKPDFIPIYLYSRENSLDGDYSYRYETANGITVEERGVMLNKGTEDEANSVTGYYRYTTPDGTPIEVIYTAGVEGFKVYGAHLPAVPPAGSANLPKNLGHKQNVASGPFARPQFRSDVLAPLPSPSPSPLVQSATTAIFEAQTNYVQNQEVKSRPEVPGPEQASFAGTPTETKIPAPSVADQAEQSQTASSIATPAHYYQQQQSVPNLPVFPAPTPQIQTSFPQFQPQLDSRPPSPPSAVQTQPKVVQRLLAPSVAQPQFRPPAFNQQRSPVRQYTVEPQQVWYAPQQGRHFQMPQMQRTLEPPKY